jgi:transposase
MGSACLTSLAAENAALLAKRDGRKKVAPLLPRGRRGAHRVDDRRLISGIVHMLRSGSRWRDCPPEYGTYTTIYNRFSRWSRQGIWVAMFKSITGSTGVIGTAAIDSSHVKVHRCSAGEKKGAFQEAIGRSRGGRTTAVHALTDAEGRPHVLLVEARGRPKKNMVNLRESSRLLEKIISETLAGFSLRGCNLLQTSI